jgi:hypothetical protein
MAVRSSSSLAVTADDGFGSGAFQNLDSAASAGPAASAGSGQAGAKHDPGTVEGKTVEQFGVPTVLLRVPCSCGWRGAWYADPEYVARSFARHVEARS